MAQQEPTIKKRSEGRRRKFMEAISRWSKLSRNPVADIRSSPQKMPWHNRLRHLVNSESQKQIKLDETHVACVPNNNNEKEQNIPSTSKGHRCASEDGQLNIPAPPAVERRSFSHPEGAHAYVWSPVIRWDPRPQQRRQPRDRASVSEAVRVLLTFSWQTRADTYAPTTLYLYPIKEIPCFCKQYDECFIFNTVICSWELP